ncbi:MAG: hypothetical protein ACLPT6_07090 [Desulfobaccales bacterium]
MPKIPPELLNCAFYLYDNKTNAMSGKNYGGTGFLVAIPSERFPHIASYVYGVTNWHIALDQGCSVIRINKLDGTPHIYDFEPSQWEWFPNKDDIAISPLLSGLDLNIHAIKAVHIKAFVTEKVIKENEIDIGDDVFMIGRFIDHDGGPTNAPAARFGHISVMPSPIIQPTGYMGKSYCIDLNSRGGYSGSPVFVYRTPGGNLDETFRTGKPFSRVLSFLNLLGIHWGQFEERYPIVSYKQLALQQSIIKEGEYAKGLSGMTCVIPADRILELLNIQKLKDKRIEEDALLETHFQETGYPPEPESAIPNTENPQHKEDFTSLVSAAVKTKLQDD